MPQEIDGNSLSHAIQSSNEPNALVAEKPSARVWRACLECRLKKRKCDGQDICGPCQTRNRPCEYPRSNDNASSSRQLTATLEARCRQLEILCEQMQTMMSNLTSTVDNLDSFRQSISTHDIGPNVPFALNSAPGAGPNIFGSHEEQLNRRSPYIGFENEAIHVDETGEQSDTSNRDTSSVQSVAGPDEDKDEDMDENGESFSGNGDKSLSDHVMTVDSYGKLRFVGGTGTMEMIEALKSLNSSDANSSVAAAATPSTSKSVSVLELPWFSRGKTWPRLSYLPTTGQLPRPPRYVSDLLINLYFDQLHYTFPILYKPHFLQRYNLLMNARDWDNVDAPFLAVFYGVCACASGLLPRDPNSSSTFTGMNFYEPAILLHYAATGEGTVEQVQCLSLLSMCTAGWNTLAQSWKFSGQAVRAAQDLGLHRSPARGTGQFLKEELCRRIWWSVYGLDRVLSTCLGRPMAIDDADCDSELPLDLDDDDLEAYGNQQTEPPTPPQATSTSLLSGFLAFTKLCQISGKIVQSMSSLHLQRMRKRYGKKAKAKISQMVQSLDLELAEWLQNMPDSVKFSVNNPSSVSPHLTMCVISYILHAGCIINLYRPLIRYISTGVRVVLEANAQAKCLEAARSCIQVAELIQERIPPSHHIAYCTHYLALSGLILLRLSDMEAADVTRNVTSCIRYLSNLEPIFSGAKRSRLILEELLQNSRSSQLPKKRVYDELDMDEVPWGNDLFNQDIFLEFSYPNNE